MSADKTYTHATRPAHYAVYLQRPTIVIFSTHTAVLTSYSTRNKNNVYIVKAQSSHKLEIGYKNISEQRLAVSSHKWTIKRTNKPYGLSYPDGTVGPSAWMEL